MLLSEWAVKLLIDELLADYFNSVSYKIMFCLACLEEETELVDDTVEISKKSQSKKKRKKNLSQKSRLKRSSKSNLNLKIYLLLKYCS